jgi:hypothetical protein
MTVATVDTPILTTIQGVTSGVAVIALIARGRWRLGWSFAAYNALSVVACFITLVWPEQFYNHATWLRLTALSDLQKVGIGLEAGWRKFAAFPGAAAAARKTALLILAATVVALAVVPVIGPHSTSFQTAVVNVHPRAIDGAIWLMAAVLALARWYRVPVDRFHTSVLSSFALYLLFFSSLLRLFEGRDFAATRMFFNTIDAAVFILLTCWWIHIAWRAENGADRLHVNTLRTLQGGAYS